MNYEVDGIGSIPHSRSEALSGSGGVGMNGFRPRGYFRIFNILVFTEIPAL